MAHRRSRVSGRQWMPCEARREKLRLYRLLTKVGRPLWYFERGCLPTGPSPQSLAAWRTRKYPLAA